LIDRLRRKLQPLVDDTITSACDGFFDRLLEVTSDQAGASITIETEMVGSKRERPSAGDDYDIAVERMRKLQRQQDFLCEAVAQQQALIDSIARIRKNATAAAAGSGAGADAGQEHIGATR
jgi:hypothetical protein